MQLFVLGPAFGLPSIDPDCNAAVALLKAHAKYIDQWSIVSTHDERKRLPCLVTPETTIEGFGDIARFIGRHVLHVQRTDDPTHDADRRADAIALMSFVESHAPIVLDTSLYISYENFTTTRSAFTQILPWYANYSLPPARRKAARKRTEHLGIGSIDVDDVHEDLSNRPGGFDVGKEPLFEAETQKRASLLLGGRKTVRSLLQRPEHAAAFKLHALAQNFFGPLQDILGADHYFFGKEEPGDIDCLVYGYLSLMLFPKMPLDWLAKTMREKYRSLVIYTERIHKRLGLDTNVDEVMRLTAPASDGSGLPWEPRASCSVGEVLGAAARDLANRVPLISTTAVVCEANDGKETLHASMLPATLGAAVMSVGALLCYVQTANPIFWPRGDELHIFGRKRLSDYGHLGAALAGVSLLSSQAAGDAAFTQHQEVAQNPVHVEVQYDEQG